MSGSPSFRKNASENHFHAYRHQAVKVTRDQIEIAGHIFSRSESLNCGEGIGTVPFEEIAQIATYYDGLTQGEYRPQVAALVCAVTKNPQALDLYFPIVKLLNEAETREFHQLVRDLAHHPELDLQLWGENHTPITDQMQSDIAYLVAGHLAEIFFYRRDILERFLSRPRHIRLYVTRRAFVDDGGQAGGDYDPGTESLQLVLAR